MTASAVSGGGGAGGGGSRGCAADHMLFYSVCQATFYVMCFRGADIATMDAVTDQVGVRDACLVRRVDAVIVVVAFFCVLRRVLLFDLVFIPLWFDTSRGFGDLF